MRTLRSIFSLTDWPDPYIIAEAGVNHDGSVAEAHALVDCAADAGADAVKFQTFEPASLVSRRASAAGYQVAGTGVRSQRKLLDGLVLPTSAWPELRAHAAERGLDFLSTPFDLTSLDLLCSLPVEALKLGSGELTNRPLLQEVARRGLPVLASTGMATLEEVESAVAWLSAAPGLLLMHCVSSYPAPIEQANLRAMVTMRNRFRVPVGWSDHTVGAVTAIAAVALGTAVLEKHVTLDTSRPGPDHAASADPAAFTAYVAQVRAARVALGSGEKAPTAAEAENIAVVRRSWHATRSLRAGDRLVAADLAALRPAVGVSAAEDLVGRRLRGAVAPGDPIRTEDLMPRLG